MTPYEALYGSRCRYLFCWDEIRVRKLLHPMKSRVGSSYYRKKITLLEKD